MKKEEWLLVVLALLLCLIDVLVCIYDNIVPKIVLIEEDMVLLLGQAYQEPGYQAFKGNDDYTKNIVVKNNVNFNKIGEYEIVYQLVYHQKQYKKTRKVRVVDQEKPTITLIGEKNVTICPNGIYQEEGYRSTDNYDGDLTKQVKIITGQDQIIYSVQDQSKNETVVKRKLTREDKVPPVITLLGNHELSLWTGEVYQEAGYQASDICDNDLTSQVIVTGNVDTATPGTYTLLYSVQDNSGNKTEITRTVVVKSPISGSGKVIYLTFDDGPSRTITPGILDILKEENVKATFFVVHKDPSLQYLIKQAYNEGHTIALHSYSHNYKQIYAASSNYFADLYAIQSEVKAITGVAPTIIRFPGGSSNTVSRFNPGIMSYLAGDVVNKGFRYFDWNVESGDAGKAQTANDVYQNVINGLKLKNNVVLMHDFENNYKTLHALRDVIREAKQRGYIFAPITDQTLVVHHRVAN